MSGSLLAMAEGDSSADELLTRFLAFVEARGLELYPAQEEAVLELFAGKNVILATPTGSGKSLVAAALAGKTFAERSGGKSFYTAPIKALVSEKFFALCRDLGAEHVGLMTGDATVNRDAKVICCTAEILASLALREGADAEVASVVLDEFHYYSDRERGVAWQVPLLTLPRAQFLLMSGTLGDTTFFERELSERTGRETVTVRTSQRPVPLDFEYRETPLHETLRDLLDSERAPVYVVHFAQRAATELAQDLMSVEIANKERKNAIKEELHGVRWDSPYGKDLQRYVKHGVGVHHAGLLPKYRLIVEKLAQKGLLPVICGTDTLGVGINVPIRTVLFTQLCKYDGQKTAILSVRDFHQIAGRAGRRGYDSRGWVIAQAPEHVIENKIARNKAGDDAKKLRKIVAKKPPERGYVPWDEQTFQKLIGSEPERLESRFRISHGLVLNVVSGAAARGERGCSALRNLISSVHETRARKFAHGRHAIALIRSLEQAGVLRQGNEGLELDPQFGNELALNQPLSLFVVDALPKLDRQSDTFAPDVLSLVEAVIEDPDVVLQKQLDALKEAKLRELKAEGVEYEARMAELEKLDVPRPLREFLEPTFEEFRGHHPWVGRAELRPKSVVRDMWERGASFSDYIKEYGLLRSEGVLLRYLSDAYRTLVSNVPDIDRNEALDDVIEWLRAIVRTVDSSLVDEWESLVDPRAQVPSEVAPRAPAESDLTSDVRAFTVLVRNALWKFVRALSRREFESAASLLEAGDSPWTGERLEQALVDFEVDHGAIRTDPAARAPAMTRIEKGKDAWLVLQTLLDAEEEGDWFLRVRIDLAKCRERGEVVLELLGIGPTD